MKLVLCLAGLFVGSLCSASPPYPPPESLSPPEGLERVMVEPPNNQYKFLHDAARVREIGPANNEEEE